MKHLTTAFTRNRNIPIIFIRSTNRLEKCSRGAPVILCAELNENFPEVKYAATLSNAGGIYTSDNKTIGTPLFKWVNQNYTRLFPPKVIAGNMTDPIPTTEDGTKRI